MVPSVDYAGSDRPVLAILCTDRPPGIEKIEDKLTVRYSAPDELASALPGADALFVWDFLSEVIESAWPAADQLRWTHIASAGVNTLMFDDLVNSDVVVTNSRGVFDDSIAEYVLGTVLSFAKDFVTTLDNQRARRWQHRETERIAGKRALVVGTGPIGRSIARLLRAAGLDVAGGGRTARSNDPDFGVVHPTDELIEHLGWADYVVCVAPLTDRTTGMFDAKAFAAMKPTARFINVGRGPQVVTDDLVAALSAGTIAGAALDVFEAEPLPADHVLWSMPNVLVSPHMSADFIGWKSALAEVFTDNLNRWLTGQPLRNVVDKRLGYVPSGS